MWKEFKKFAMKGNVVDLAIGVVIGAAFGKIVSSLVSDIIMPIVGILVGKIDFSKLHIKVGDATINYGVFLNNVIDFLIIAFSIFIVIRQFERFKKKEIPSEPTTKTCPYCYSEIHIDSSRCAHCTSEL